MHISFVDGHTAGNGSAARNWGSRTGDQIQSSFVTTSMQAPSSAPTDSESAIPTMQALPPQPGALPCFVEPNSLDKSSESIRSMGYGVGLWGACALLL